MSRGESNSALVIGTRGAGKTTLVNAAIELSVCGSCGVWCGVVWCVWCVVVGGCVVCGVWCVVCGGGGGGGGAA